MILRKLKEAAEAYLGHTRPQGGHHRAGVLQRRPAPGDHRGGPDRRLRHRMGDRRPADRQEDASSACASSTSRRPPRWPTASTRRRTRRSPSSTSAAARSTSPSWTSATASSRSKAINGDTHLGGDDFDQVLIDYIADEFKKEQRHRPAQGPDGPAAAQGSGRAGQEGPVAADDDRHQPAVHHGRRHRGRSTCRCR